jgi:alanyl-tRNA synthetase
MLTSQQIRQQFLDFFVKKCGHTAVPSAPVVPHGDATLLFTNAGMNQFKDVFLGVGSRPYTRAVDTQKCIRAGGKHNDLDDVGKDTYHHTFFEMLGNWSFGDYFKTDAINWAWDLLVKQWGMDPKRIHATYFEGNPAAGLEPDDEARKLWLQYLPPEHVHTGNMKDNFWEMGDTGPCGPCTEIHVDLTPENNCGHLVNAGDARVIEIWNLVFIQFNRNADQTLSSLPAKHVDTGMGFERLCAVLQGKTSNYDSDVFTPLFDAIQKITSAPAYGGKLDSPIDIAYRVIADHARCLTFAITDGALPSNEGRGYVLRRILRRGVRYGRQNLNMAQPFLSKLVAVVAEQMGDVFPELRENPQRVAEIIHEEEESFSRTLDRGIESFLDGVEDWVDSVVNTFGSNPRGYTINDAGERSYSTSSRHLVHYRDKSNEIRSLDITNIAAFKAFVAEHGHVVPPIISAEKAFRLYDTDGFPLDLTVLMAQERGMAVDTAGFEKLMEEARQLSRAAGGHADSEAESLLNFVQQNKLPATKFVGYDRLVVEDGRALALLANREGHFSKTDALKLGQPAAIVVGTTPFYAESGGQVGDTGTIHSRHGAVFRVTNTTRIGDVAFHLGTLEEGSTNRGEPAFSDDDTLVLEIDAPRRRRIMAHHTSTHLMNLGLRAALGDHVTQKGSLVDDTRTRFDFAHGKPVAPDEIEKVQQLVNAQIAANLTVHTNTVPQEDALKIRGLRAVFGEKYPPKVRVVSIGPSARDLLANPDSDLGVNHSVEFCGGTHLATTGPAEQFVVLSEEAVAKGVRRITALAGEVARRAVEHAKTLNERLDKLAGTKPEVLEKELASITELMSDLSLPLLERAKLREKLGELQKVVKEQRKLQSKQAEGGVAEAARKIADGADGVSIVALVPGADGTSLRVAMDVVRKKRPELAMLLAAHTDGKLAFIAQVPDPLIARGLKAGDWLRDVAAVVGGKGGGKPDVAQGGGGDPAKLPEALDSARKFAAAKLG